MADLGPVSVELHLCRKNSIYYGFSIFYEKQHRVFGTFRKNISLQMVLHSEPFPLTDKFKNKRKLI